MEDTLLAGNCGRGVEVSNPHLWDSVSLGGCHLSKNACNYSGEHDNDGSLQGRAQERLPNKYQCLEDVEDGQV